MRALPTERTRVRRQVGFVVVLVALTVFLIGASAPSPFYPVLQERIGFSSVTMTLIFAVYAVSMLVTLLLTGSLSDHLGRRPVITAGLLVLAVSMTAFWQAETVGLLIAARVVQGFGAGLLMSSMSAAVVDLEPVSRPGWGAIANSVTPLAGLAAGGLIAGLVLEYVDEDPFTAVFGVLTGLFVLMALLVWVAPETSARRAGVWASLRPNVGVPPEARAAFLRALPALIAGWATSGFYLSLGAPLVAQELGGDSHVAQGVAITAINGAGAAMCFVARGWSGRRVTLYGTTTLAVGTALTLVALAAGSLPWFLAAAVFAGTGFGASFMGVMRSITPLAPPERRGELFAAVFVASYVAFGVPAVLAGFAVGEFGLTPTAMVYGGVVVALSALAALLRKFGSPD
ncbi:MFS transporter [Aeromicrobium choanae]|uniref:Predicted arabinose efflux permease, MFS family n=1 Tax=Aeromicrobium choanae TaxID=1736691 RepID=A0A1T4Z8C4_9ACTN|nr:MFS transporter [Aeromicrobium choanae]SKB10310.1 Predicted arabinose efflux permease, MFS family [Aeromicrobium choanae]